MLGRTCSLRSASRGSLCIECVLKKAPKARYTGPLGCLVEEAEGFVASRALPDSYLKQASVSCDSSVSR
jgi:hypothetical protein